MKEIDINNQMMIYFYSPQGTYSRIQYCLYLLGLDKKKKIGNTYLHNLAFDIARENDLNRYFKYDVIYLDGFYDSGFYGQAGKERFIESEEMTRLIVEFVEKLTRNGVQIVMAGHGRLDSISALPKKLKDQIVEIDLFYDEGWSYDYEIEYGI